MKRRFRGVLFCGFLLSGCVSGMPERTKPAGIEVETIRTSVASVREAEVSIEGGRLLVSGHLRRLHEVNLPGYVDIVLCGPEGLLEKKSAPVPGLSSKRRGVMDLPFRMHFDQVPPQGSKVRIRYHAPAAKDENILRCE